VKPAKTRASSKQGTARAGAAAESKKLRAAVAAPGQDDADRESDVEADEIPNKRGGEDGKLRPTVRKRGAALATGDTVGAADLARRIGLRLRDERMARNLSLDDLSRASGVSRAALSQIETRKSSPSISVMWKIAVGLGIPFAELLGGGSDEGTVLRRSDAQVLRSPDGRFESRPIVPAGTTPWVEVYEVRLMSRSIYRSEPHAAGTREVLVVLSGSMQIEVGQKSYDLEAGDSVAFRADQPHTYRNSGSSEARAHNVIIYNRG
jgi:XRE family transcriptional regulator, regulator of sulfur utilization